MSILFEKLTPAARDIAEAKLREEGILAPDAPLEYAFEVLPSERTALEIARDSFDSKIAACKDDVCLADMAIAKARCVHKEVMALQS
ncbi:hypothetical protein Q8W37_06635 [Shimia thalassica]|uniref:hypothetical protein n=1 Tax=Shimia thalassica TaxID=1715693 RepID=UPI000C074066|nr:hypothetical protein [Shimia thalassica]PHO04132.1 hypothetical protein CSC82_11365 [Rhodobacteraceae bacterium 4F10]MBU2941981.1 hypothetical protein [Shimia thalassica]MDO6478179.1 hypothetical protein [Shimia thalassica]MDO6483003.1 hypothetical protein [Shimia thalassica]MDO6503050.1 hypothetical protein [Shimia thalassica]